MNDWSAFFAGSLADWITAIGVIFAAYTGAVMMRNDRRKIRRSAPIIEAERTETMPDGWSRVRIDIRNTEEAKLRITAVRSGSWFGLVDEIRVADRNDFNEPILTTPDRSTAHRVHRLDHVVRGSTISQLDYYTHRCPPSSIKLSWQWVDGRSER